MSFTVVWIVHNEKCSQCVLEGSWRIFLCVFVIHYEEKGFPYVHLSLSYIISINIIFSMLILEPIEIFLIDVFKPQWVKKITYWALGNRKVTMDNKILLDSPNVPFIFSLDNVTDNATLQNNNNNKNTARKSLVFWIQLFVTLGLSNDPWHYSLNSKYHYYWIFVNYLICLKAETNEAINT